MDDRQRRIEELEDELSRRGRELSDARAAECRLRERLELVERAYGRFVPEQMLRLLRASSITDVRLGDQVERPMTIQFCDIRDFTTLVEGMSPAESFAFLNDFLGVMEPVIIQNGGVVDKYIGDAIMALYPQSADDALRGSVAMLEALRVHNERRAAMGEAPIRAGIGLNTGLVMLGAVGADDRLETTVISDAVNLASRLEASSKIYGAPLLISEHTYFALKEPWRHGIRFVDRVRVRGKVHPQSIYEVFDVDEPSRRAAKMQTRILFERALAFYHLREARAAIPLLDECLRILPDDAAAHLYLDRCHEFEMTGAFHSTGEAGESLRWGPSYALDIEVIDGQHRALFEHINELSRRVRARDASGVEESFRFLSRYALEHFGTEEALMDAYDYPMRDEHVREHERFVAVFQELKREVEAAEHEPLYLVFRVQLFLTDWLVNHTTGTDRRLGRFLRALDRPLPKARPSGLLALGA